MYLLVSMVVFLWDQEISGANTSLGCSGQAVLGFREEFREEADVQGLAHGGEGAYSSSEQSVDS